ncbi:Vacuolar transporter chaperone 1, partial [Pseudocercospora fuligena]
FRTHAAQKASSATAIDIPGTRLRSSENTTTRLYHESVRSERNILATQARNGDLVHKHSTQTPKHTTLDMSSQPLLQTAPDTQPDPKTNSNCPGKRIALPTRIEPKVFFANERTFLSWLNFTVILGGLAMGLLNFGDTVSQKFLSPRVSLLLRLYAPLRSLVHAHFIRQVGQISAILFTLVAVAAMLYALVTFHWRAKSIRMRGQGGFDDRFGPTVLAVALLGAVVVNFILRFTGTG